MTTDTTQQASTDTGSTDPRSTEPSPVETNDGERPVIRRDNPWQRLLDVKRRRARAARRRRRSRRAARLARRRASSYGRRVPASSVVALAVAVLIGIAFDYGLAYLAPPSIR